MLDRLPKKIDPCPILQTVFELRFLSQIPDDVIFGYLFPLFEEKYGSNYEKLPILQIPDQIRNGDPSLIFQPYYQLKREKFFILLGPRVIALVVNQPYPGWDIYFDELKYVLSIMLNKKVINKVIRFGLRYIDFFELDIFEKIKLEINLYDNIYRINKKMFHTELSEGAFNSVLKIDNSSELNLTDTRKRGSIIDVDNYLKDVNIFNKLNDSEFQTNIFKYLTEAHELQKKLFFSLLKKEFLDTLNPIY